MQVQPVELDGNLVQLEPLHVRHAAELYEASRDPSLWTYKLAALPTSSAEMTTLVASTLEQRDAGKCLPTPPLPSGYRSSDGTAEP